MEHAVEKTRTCQNLRVAHIVDSAQMWGIENYILSLSTTLLSKGVETWLLCRNPLIENIFRERAIQTRPFVAKGYLDPVALCSLREFILTQRIDIMHTHLGVDSLIGAAAAKACGIPCVMSVHFIQPAWVTKPLWKRRLWQCVQKLKNGMISHFLPITAQVGKCLQDREGVAFEKMTVVWPGACPAPASPESRKILRTQLGSRVDDCVILTLSRLEPEKNTSVLVASAATLIKDGLKVKFWIAGEGSQRESLERQIDCHNLRDHVLLLGYRPDKANLLGAADIFVLPTIGEGFGISAVEAMLASLPVVGFGNSGLAVIVDDGHTGLLAESGDQSALTDCIRKLAADPVLRVQLGNAGYKRALENFSDEIMAERVLQVYLRVLKK
jgi:glycosyltransferase involved in cell wall biosynthesis